MFVLQAMQTLPISVREGLMVLKIQPFRDTCLPFPLRILSDVNERLPVIAYRRNEDLLINIKVPVLHVSVLLMLQILSLYILASQKFPEKDHR